jgi:hypothetical protein
MLALFFQPYEWLELEGSVSPVGAGIVLLAAQVIPQPASQANLFAYRVFGSGAPQRPFTEVDIISAKGSTP